MFLFITVINGY